MQLNREMLKKSINCFISSRNRPEGENISDILIELPDNAIQCGETEYIQLNVLSFDMLNTMYNINSTNNKFNILRKTPEMDLISERYYEIPEGNYNVISLRDWMAAVLPAIDVIYNPAQNTFTFQRIAPQQIEPAEGEETEEPVEVDDSLYFFKALTCGKFIGLENAREYEVTTSGLITSYVNLSNYSKVILRTQNINYDMNTVENLNTRSNKLTFSDILFWKSKQDIQPFTNIQYSNEDSGNSFNLILQDRKVSNLRLQLKNELNEFIDDAPDYLLVLQFNIMERTAFLKNTLLTMSQNLRDIWVTFLYVMEKLNLLK